MEITLLLTQYHRPLSVAALLDFFESVNAFYKQDIGSVFFDINIACAEEGVGFDNYIPKPLAAVVNTDLILIPAFKSGDLPAYLKANYQLIPWLHEQFQKKAEIASFCTGAYLLAVAGLLNGKRATTHVNAVHEFKKQFPEVLLEKDEVVTDDDGIYTSGGATSSFHLMLYLLEKFCGREMAVKASKYFAIDPDRKRQSHFASFVPVRHQDRIIASAQEQMEKVFFEINTVDELIKDLPVSKRNFIRRFKMATGNTPLEYLQHIRIEASKKILENSNASITEVMYEVGYSDAKAFRKLFKRIVGLTPRAYKKKFEINANPALDAEMGLATERV